MGKCIPHSSNTVKVCRRLLREWTRHKGEVWCYGDATGGSGGSAKLEGSDWELIRKILRPVFRDRLKIKARKSNPRERDRVNSVNSRLCSTEGIVKMVLDGRWTTNLIKDFEGTLVVEGGSGEIDKKKYPDLSHMTDALGYYNNQEFPIKKKGEFFAY